MKVEKLPSGTYRATKMCKGKRYRVTFDHDPDDMEVTIALAEKMQETQTGATGTFEYVAKEYISNRKNVTSPSTERTYNIKINQLSDDFKTKKIYDITNDDVQIEVNRLAKKYEPKTVKTTYGFISSVLALNRPSLKLRVKLPQKIEKENYEPSSEQIKALLEYVKGTDYSVPFQLGVFGLRRAEICALNMDDLKDNVLHIHKNLVYNNDNEWVIKESPKTDASNRTITLPDVLVKEIQEQGYIYSNHPGALLKALHRYQKKLGIPQFRFHDLRVYFASYAHSLGIPDSDIMAIGGWSTDGVMKRIYRKSLEESKKNSMNKIASSLFE